MFYLRCIYIVLTEYFSICGNKEIVIIKVTDFVICYCAIVYNTCIILYKLFLCGKSYTYIILYFQVVIYQ